MSISEKKCYFLLEFYILIGMEQFSNCELSRISQTLIMPLVVEKRNVSDLQGWYSA